jgi:hypothetical protein
VLQWNLSGRPLCGDDRRHLYDRIRSLFGYLHCALWRKLCVRHAIEWIAHLFREWRLF